MEKSPQKGIVQIEVPFRYIVPKVPESDPIADELGPAGRTIMIVGS
jgi:hypothetical protein